MSATIEVSQRDLAATAPLVPGTKTARHASIVQILSRERIRSQAQLRKALAQRGISTTQATLSRDLVELRATKIRAPGGELIYSMPEAGAPGGAAQLLAGAVDDAMMPGVMGCIAGDDTVLVITRGAQVAADVARHLLALADPSARA